MDAYIEACHLWEDFHHDLILEIKGVLASHAPDRYVVRTGERAYVVMSVRGSETREHSFWSDVSVASAAAAPAATVAASLTGTSLAPDGETAPIAMQALVETEYREVFLEIREPPPAKTLVTCIEVLSPSNKRPGTKGWRLYNTQPVHPPLTAADSAWLQERLRERQIPAQ
jgi:hypothetical protein